MTSKKFPGTVAFGSLAIKLQELYVREAEAGEDFSKSLPTKLEFAFAAGDNVDHIARLKLTITVESALADSARSPLMATSLAEFALTNAEDKHPLPTFQSNDLPNNLKAKLLGICLDTIRGELQARTAGFAIGNHPLPVFNPMELLESTEQQRT